MPKIRQLIALLVSVSSTALWGQGTPITLSLAGNANATAAGANLNFTLGGTGSVTGFGNATLSGAGVIDVSTLGSFGLISGTFTLIFSGTDVVVGTFAIPPGVIVPQIGGSSSATGTAKIIGGAGKFTGATGSFTGLTGTGTATGATSTSFQVSGTGTIVTPAAPSPGVLNYAGSIAHIASGDGWKTTLTFVNTGATAAQLRLSFFDQTGGPLALPVTYPQTPATPAGPTSTIERTLAAGAILIIESQGGQTLSVGSAQVSTDGAITGSAIFRYTVSGQEAVVPLETRNPAAFVLPFDNTAGLANGLAISNVSATPASVKITIKDESGANSIVTDILTLSARGHTSFVLSDRYALTGQRRGTIVLETPDNGQISALGIRANTTGAYTSIPPGVK